MSGECDKCGVSMAANDSRRFIVKLEVYAADGPVDLGSEEPVEAGQKLAEVLEQLSKADPDEIEDQTYRSFRFDLCDTCRRKLLNRPLG